MQEALCILHAGTEKTGTTSIQRFLHLNREALARGKIWVPRSLAINFEQGLCNHARLCTASRLSISTPDDLQTMLGLPSMEMVCQHRQDVMSALALEYAGLGYRPSRVIVSSEHIHSRLGTAQDIENAKALLAPYCNDFKVLVYLRNQADLAQSLAATSVRLGATVYRQIPDFTMPGGYDRVLGVGFAYFDYAGLLERLEEVFGAAALQAGLYEGRKLRNGDIIDDFFDRIGVDIAGMSRSGRENGSLNGRAIQFLMSFNKIIEAKQVIGEIRALIIDYLDKHFSGSIRPAPQPQRAEFMAQFSGGNEIVRSRWFPGLTTLFPDKTADVGAGQDHGEALTPGETREMLRNILGNAAQKQ